jgi:hypothetical protein
MALDQALAFKLSANYRGIKMLAIALHRKVCARKALLNVGLYLFWGWEHRLLHKRQQ